MRQTLSRAGSENKPLNVRAALQHRIAVAARVVCGFEESKLYDVVIATKACRNGAIEGARPAYEAALSSARHGTVIVGEAAIIVSAR